MFVATSNTIPMPSTPQPVATSLSYLKHNSHAFLPSLLQHHYHIWTHSHAFLPSLLQHHYHIWNTIPMPSPLPVATSLPFLEHNCQAFVTGVTRYGDTQGYQGWYSLLGYCGTRFRAVLRSRHSRYTESNCIGRVYE